ncbi:MAG: hypothetical protein KF729_26970 [Sandaracinaceae bacterium]|nr:hypothetical protein [Sandaracinaceae bacterium]
MHAPLRSLVFVLALALASCDASPAADAGTHGDAGPTPRDAGSDASTTDASTTDASTTDAGTTDASTMDAGEDAGAMDAGEGDAGEGDASATDGGTTDAAGGDCADEELTLDVLVDASTVGAGDDRDPSGDGCPFPRLVTGPDRVYGFTAPSAGLYEVTLVPEDGLDPMLYVLGACDAAACVTGANLNGAGGDESVTFTLGAGARVLVVVDTDITGGPLVGGGRFLLEITRI